MTNNDINNWNSTLNIINKKKNNKTLEPLFAKVVVPEFGQIDNTKQKIMNSFSEINEF